MVSIVRHVFLGLPVAQQMDWHLMLRMAKKHNLIPFLFVSMDATTPDEVRSEVTRIYYQNVGQMIQQNAYSETLFASLRKVGIPYLPLKGFALRPLYPDPVLRSCYDLDILFLQKDREALQGILEEQGFSLTLRELHQDTYQKDFVTIEAHISLVEPHGKGESYYKDIWPHLISEDGVAHAFTAEDFYVYHLLHMFKHMKNGGCGVRSIVDVWLWRKNHPEMDEAYLKSQYEILGLTKFATVAESLAKAWFEGEPLNEDLDLIESFILSGGAYGTLERHAQMHAGTKKLGSRFKYLMRRLFLARHHMIPNYPILERAPILLPVCWVIRFFRILFSPRRQEIKRELEVTSKLGTDATAAAHRVREIIGDPVV